jgi:hypothetical protein
MPHVHCDCVLFNDTVNYGDEEQVWSDSHFGRKVYNT